MFGGGVVPLILTVRADETVDGAGGNVEREPIDGGGAVETLRDVGELDGVGHVAVILGV